MGGRISNGLLRILLKEDFRKFIRRLLGGLLNGWRNEEVQSKDKENTPK